MEHDLSLEEARDFLYQRKTTYNKTYKLDRVICLFEQLNLRQLPCPVIHVTGTNGKGSTCAMLESIYRTAGFKTGLFTSPHLISVLERVQVSGQMISETAFLRLFNHVHRYICMLEKENPDYRFSFFEYLTVMALLYFVECQVDVVILEVGMGGRLDATNALAQTTCSVITTIAFDHENVLGNTLEAIAREKAGIIKDRSLVFLGNAIQEGPKKVIQTIADQKQSIVYQVKTVPSFFDKTVAAYQNYNAATAQLIAKTLTQKGILSVTDDEIEHGIRTFHWPARWQKINYKNKLLIFDGAHNEEGALALAHEIQHLPEPPVLIFGSNTEERAKKILKILLPICKKTLLSSSTHEQALSQYQLVHCLPHSSSTDTPTKVEYIELEKIPLYLQNTDESVLVIAGSLYLIGDSMRQLGLAL